MTLTPYLTVNDAKSAIDWYEKVFGASIKEGEYFESDGKVAHATLLIGEVSLFLSDPFPELGAIDPHSLNGTCVALVLDVPDVDAVYKLALSLGATSQKPPKDQMGFRSAWFLDPYGHRWSPTTHPK